MVSQALRDKVRRYRRDYPSATLFAALCEARAQERGIPEDWKDGRGPVLGWTTQRDGFDIAITVDYDDVTDLSYMGTVTWCGSPYREDWPAKPDPHAVGYVSNDRSGARGWYVSEYSYSDRVKHYRSLGWARNAADLQATADIEAEARLFSETTSYVIRVTASRKGVKLGEDSLGGVDVADYRDTEFVSTVLDHEMIEDAIADARATLASLCEDS